MMMPQFECLNRFKWAIRKGRFSSVKSALSSEDLKKIKDLRKITNLSVGICKNILNKNGYNIERSVDYIFQNFNESYEREVKLTEGYYCLSSRGNCTAIVELNSYNDLVSESIYFKELLINLCNKLIGGNVTTTVGQLNLDEEVLSHYLPLFYDENKINVDKMLNRVELKDIFKYIYFNRSISQLINYTSYILNEHIFLSKYLLLNLDHLRSCHPNVYIIKKSYYHKETKIDNFVLCKGFSFSFLFIKSDEVIPEPVKLILEKFASLICVNILIYKSKRCSNANQFDIHGWFFVNHFGRSANELGQNGGNASMQKGSQLGSTKGNAMKREGAAREEYGGVEHDGKEHGDEEHDDEKHDDFLQKKVQSFCILSEYIEKMDHKGLTNILKEDVTFSEMIKLMEDQFKIKIFVKIMYSVLNEDMLIL
ncbi:hypothetical protein PCYB_127230 [Plasmodium cynomolgi strain B]|uniref:Uncharacterized protein n=1 Tax=Plasmodium cynomolgi (strain B) TaxID=1120755 RepID=K6ULZ6_PLACD|nr:hypothetical protein PCYB_127230 [Plasmodium cynomolgi strain B]GAB68158.1 hypothetical protein PCYB_127230 [Plasmodium cynomolgi strain B]